MKELIRLDKDGALTKVNIELLKRCAAKLQDYIKIATERVQMKFDLDNTLLPIVNSVIDDTITLPFKGKEPVDVVQLYVGTGLTRDTFPNEMVRCYLLFSKLLYGNITLAEGFYYETEDIGKNKKFNFKNKKFVFEHDGEYYVWADLEHPPTYQPTNNPNSNGYQPQPNPFNE